MKTHQNTKSTKCWCESQKYKKFHGIHCIWTKLSLFRLIWRYVNPAFLLGISKQSAIATHVGRTPIYTVDTDPFDREFSERQSQSRSHLHAHSDPWPSHTRREQVIHVHVDIKPSQPWRSHLNKTQQGSKIIHPSSYQTRKHVAIIVNRCNE